MRDRHDEQFSKPAESDDRVEEATQELATNVMLAGVLLHPSQRLRRFPDQAQRRLNFVQKLASQPRLPFLVPASGCNRLALSFRQDSEAGYSDSTAPCPASDRRIWSIATSSSIAVVSPRS